MAGCDGEMTVKRVILEIDLGKYKSVELPIEDAKKLISHIVDTLGFEPTDVNEFHRIIRNFDMFYDIMRRRFQDYLVPSKNMNDMILGRVIVDKVKLIKEGNERRVLIVFDKRVPEDVIAEGLRNLGYDVEVKRYKLEEELGA